MGCSTCKKAGAIVPKTYRYREPLTSTREGCPYTEEQLLEWRLLLLCVKNTGIRAEFNLTEAQLNSHIGIVVSAINHKYNLCYFEKHLSKIEPLILTIINSGKCQ